mmetsp:Transcript_50249/g.122657  ORF Transcript_50249/g.122657 Transcript_50249/m.122657 type:complete len:123 (-) Transcript_50249:205-573(-)
MPLMKRLSKLCRGKSREDVPGSLGLTDILGKPRSSSRLVAMAGVGLVNKDCAARTVHQSSACSEEPGGTRIPSTCAPGKAWVDAHSSLTITSLALGQDKAAVCVVICEDDVHHASADFKARF